MNEMKGSSRDVVCTLFEGNYHKGLASLVNSLHWSGFKGQIIAGYRGPLPAWAKEGFCSKWGESDAFMLNIGEIELYFIALATKVHFTNYKPDFLGLLLETDPSYGRIFYFDPDIVVTTPWSFFQQWVDSGVALCEDLNSPLPQNHPTRSAWRTYFSKYGLTLSFKGSIYVNGGFVGLTRENVEFIKIWDRVQIAMADAIGGLAHSDISDVKVKASFSVMDPFSKTDQDALNASVEIFEGKVSIIGQEGMGFKPGAQVMLHAVGAPKPWNKNFLLRILQGFPPTSADKGFWRFATGPIAFCSPTRVVWRSFCLRFAVVISRFYRRQE